MTIEVLIQDLVTKDGKGRRKNVYRVSLSSPQVFCLEKDIERIEGVANFCRTHKADEVYLNVGAEDYFRFWDLY